MKWLLSALFVVVIVAASAWFALTPSAPEIITGVKNSSYSSDQLGFSLEYPSTATASEVGYDGYLPLTGTPVTSFVLPKSMSAGTNLGEAGVYIGATTSPAIVSACTTASADRAEKTAGGTLLDKDQFSVFTSSDAGAGNFYETTSYRGVKNGICIEIVEMLHSGNIGNYPEGAVTAFDHEQFSDILESIVHTYRSR